MGQNLQYLKELLLRVAHFWTTCNNSHASFHLHNDKAEMLIFRRCNVYPMFTILVHLVSMLTLAQQH